MEEQAAHIGDDAKLVEDRESFQVAFNADALGKQIERRLAAEFDADIGTNQSYVLQRLKQSRLHVVGPALECEGDRHATTTELLTKSRHSRLAFARRGQELLVVK